MSNTAVYDPMTIAEAIIPDVTDSINAYTSDREQADSNLTEWLTKRLQAHDPNAARTASEIVDELRNQDAHLVSIRKASAEGISNESWLADTLEKATASVSAQATAGYYQEIGHTVGEAEQALMEIVRNQNGSVSQNVKGLHGLIAEEFHVQTFNVNAAGKNSTVRARRNASNGKDSVDITVEKPLSGFVNEQQYYQVKYGKTAADTIRMLKQGNYQNQQIVVPPEQVEAVKKAFPNQKVISTLEYDRILSDGLPKKVADRLSLLARTDPAAYDREIKKLFFKKMAQFVVKGAIYSAAFGAILNSGLDIIGKKIRHEEIHAKDVVAAALKGGADMGVKAAITSSVVIAAGKGAINCIPKGTPAEIIAGIVHIAVENVKIMAKTAAGELSPMQGLDKMGEVTTAGVGGLAGSIAGGKIGGTIGAAVGTVFGPVGTAVGGAIGAIVGGVAGYAAGSHIGQRIYEGAKKLGSAAFSWVKEKVDRFTKRTPRGRRTNSVYA